MFKHVPVDIIQMHEKSIVDLFIKREDKLEIFLQSGGVFTKEHLTELNRRRISRMYIRSREVPAFEGYIHSYLDRILTDPTVPSGLKAETFYVSSIRALRKAFDDPNSEKIEEIKKTLKPMFKNIMENKILLGDLFSITRHDFSTYTHSVNVGIFATALAVYFFQGNSTVGWEYLERLSYGYFVHDIGKSRVPLSLLRKEGPLSDEEWVIMKKHPEWGYTILMETGHLTDEAAYISMQHHERPDGSGYPYGMKDIHPCARICTIADLFDALTSARPYKKALKPYEAIEIIKEGASTEFDKYLMQSFIRMLGPQKHSEPAPQTELIS